MHLITIKKASQIRNCHFERTRKKQRAEKRKFLNKTRTTIEPHTERGSGEKSSSLWDSRQATVFNLPRFLCSASRGRFAQGLQTSREIFNSPAGILFCGRCFFPTRVSKVFSVSISTGSRDWGANGWFLIFSGEFWVHKVWVFLGYFWTECWNHNLA